MSVSKAEVQDYADAGLRLISGHPLLPSALFQLCFASDRLGSYVKIYGTARLHVERETKPGKYADRGGMYLIVASATSPTRTSHRVSAPT